MHCPFQLTPQVYLSLVDIWGLRWAWEKFRGVAMCLELLSCWKTQRRHPIYPYKVPRSFQAETGLQHHQFSNPFNSGHGMFSCVFILGFTTDSLRVFVAKKFYLGLIWPKHMTPVKIPLLLGKLHPFTLMSITQKRVSLCMLLKQLVGMYILLESCLVDLVTTSCYHFIQFSYTEL